MEIDNSNVIISDEDIDWVEKQMGLQFDCRRREVIKNLESVDVQAFAGTGKTTVLVAKLAIIVKKWSYGNKGICVLSHTNTARKEIEKRLGNTDVGRKLLSYPHFVGTIHGFFNTFIATPWLRSHGYPIYIIDNDIVFGRRWSRLSRGEQYALEKSSFSIENFQVGSLPKRPSPDSSTGQSLVRIIKESQERGEFTYNEMLISSMTALENACFSNILQLRFPFAFIDEAQDTDAMLTSLLEHTFCSSSAIMVVQNYGDSNQAIFDTNRSKNEKSNFPRAGYLTIPDSLRFSDKVASFAKPMSINANDIFGTNTQYLEHDDNHTIFLFDSKHPSAALPAFARHLLSCFTDEELQNGYNDGIYAIGQVGKGEEDAKIPHSIKHYFPLFDSNTNTKLPRPQNLIGFFRAGREAYRMTLENAEQTKIICKGLCRLINLSRPASDKRISETSYPINALNRELTIEQQTALRAKLLLWQNADISTSDAWATRLEEVRYITNMFGITRVDETFSSWKETGPPPTRGLNNANNNVFRYIDPNNNRTVDIELGTIHSVKGETHFATLLLDTYYRKRNVAGFVDLLCGRSRKRDGSGDIHRRRCNYVALTRSRALVCVAIPNDYIDSSCEKALADYGWNVISV